MDLLSDKAGENSDSKVVDVTKNELNEAVDIREVEYTFPAVKDSRFSLTTVPKPELFVQNSDTLYSLQPDFNVQFPTKSILQCPEGSTSSARPPADLNIQERLAREREVCSRSKNRQEDNQCNSNKREGINANDSANDDAYFHEAAEVIPDVLFRNPILPGCYRPSFSKKNSSPQKRQPSQEHLPSQPLNATLKLSVKVSEVRFYDHPLFIEEERLCSQLQLTYEKYRLHVEASALSSLKPKLSKLIPEVVSLLTSIYDIGEAKDIGKDSNAEPPSKALQSYPLFSGIFNELVEIVSLTLDEVYNTKELGSTLWSIWKNLQECRTRQKFRSTNAEVVVTTDSGKDSGGDDCQKYIQQLANCLRQVLRSLNAEEFNYLAAEGVSKHLTNQLQNLLVATETLSSVVGAPELNVTLLEESKNYATFAATTNVEELVRRRRLTSERYFLRLSLEKRFIGGTRPLSLTWPQFSLPFEHSFEYDLTKQPNNMAIELVQCAPGASLMLFNKVISSTFIGTSVECCGTREIETPTIYQFASHQAYKNKGGHCSRLKGFIRVFVDLDSSLSRKDRIESTVENLVCAPDLKAQGQFRGLIMPRRRYMMAHSKIQRPSCASKIMKWETKQDKCKYKRVEDKVTNGKDAQKMKLSEIVKQGHAFNVSLGLSSLIKPWLLPRKRSLRPSYIPRPLWFSKPSSAVSHNLVVTIVCARNVPSRTPLRSKEVLQSPQRTSPPRRFTRLSSLVRKGRMEDSICTPMTFAKVRFQGDSFVTRAVAGNSPIWKKTFSFTVRFLNNESMPHAVSLVQDALQVELFDAAEVDFGTFGGYYEDENTLLTENRYLGAFSVPFSRLLLLERSESLIRLHSPNTCIGYDKCFDVDQPSAGIASGSGIVPNESSMSQSIDSASMKRGGPSIAELLDEADSSIYIKLSIALDPPLQVQEEDSPCCTSNEDALVIKHAQRWAQRLRSNYLTLSKRLLPVFAKDTQGFDWLFTRFIKSQDPPFEMDSVYKCAYFVSLIPVQESKQIAKVWLTNKQFVENRSGSWGQHAILLASFFMSLSEKYPESCAADVSLIFGKAYPERETVYVLRESKGDGEIVLWDASKGIAYAKADERCPLDHVGAVVTPENIHANIQNSARPSLMSFDLKDKNCWRPFYSRRFPRPLSTMVSVQDSEIIYQAPDTNSSFELQVKLTESVKESIRQWRRISTCFNGDVGNRLNAILEHLECDKLQAVAPFSQKYKVMLESATKGRRIFGVDLHYPFTAVDDIISSVEAASVHMCRHPDVEFALGVRVFPYCCGIFSVRVFIVSIYP